MDENQQILLEIRDRLARVETHMEGFLDAKKLIYEADTRSRENEKAITEIKGRFTRIWGAVWSLVVGIVLALLNFFLKGDGS